MSSINKKDEYGCTFFVDTLEDNPQIITDKLGLKATEIILKGSNWLSPITKRVVEGKYNEANLWIYKIEKEYSGTGIYLNNALEKMLDIMDSQKDLLVGLLSKYPKHHILCYAYFYDPNPYFKLDKELIRRLNIYKIDIEFDIYCLAR
ncbi:DUF4279 domain-containing protein [Pedobacter terrae]|uniref:DUF4279 domain-containing protein n=1 Tax=Pedobacter terrae TaxID=405671 RepID=UPI002FF54B8C